MRRLKGTLTGCSGSAGLCAYHLPVHRLCLVLSAPPDAGGMVAVPSFQMRRLRLREVPQLARFTQCWRWALSTLGLSALKHGLLPYSQ